MGPPSINLPPVPQPPAPPMPMTPAQGVKPRANSTTLNPTILGALAPVPTSQLGTKTLLGQ